MKTYGQWNTDLKIYERYFPNAKEKLGCALAVGEYDGIKGSNIKLFEDVGWKTISIEPNPFIYEELQDNRPDSLCFNVACSYYNGFDKLEIFEFDSGVQSSLTSLKPDERLVRDYAAATKNRTFVTVVVRTINYLLESMGDQLVPDLVSIDTEGTELDVLKGFDLNKYSPTLMVVENNYEDPEIEEYLKQFNYVKDWRYYVNDFYIRK